MFLGGGIRVRSVSSLQRHSAPRRSCPDAFLKYSASLMTDVFWNSKTCYLLSGQMGSYTSWTELDLYVLKLIAAQPFLLLRFGLRRERDFVIWIYPNWHCAPSPYFFLPSAANSPAGQSLFQFKWTACTSVPNYRFFTE